MEGDEYGAVINLLSAAINRLSDKSLTIYQYEEIIEYSKAINDRVMECYNGDCRTLERVKSRLKKE